MAPPILSLPSPSMPFKRTTIWKTLPVETLGGILVNQQPWSYPRYRYQLNSGPLRDNVSFQELQALQGFFNSIGGKANLFQYNDTRDNTTAVDQSLGTGHINPVTSLLEVNFQLLRGRGGFVEPVFAPNVITNVKVNGVVQTPTTQYTVSALGVVTFVTAPPAGQSVTWTGTYYWYCTFDQDEWDFEQIIAPISLGDPNGGVWNVQQLSFTTQKFGT